MLKKNLLIGLILVGTLTIIGTILPSSVSMVRAAPPSDSLNHFTLNCGSAGSFEVGVHTGGFAKPIFILNDNRVFRVSSLAIEEVNNGEPIFNAPGLFKSNVEQLTCHFIGAETGRHFTVTGFFTPANSND